MTAKPGRKPQPEKRAQQVLFRLPPEEMDALRAAAQREGITAPEFARRAARAAIKGG